MSSLWPTNAGTVINSNWLYPSAFCFCYTVLYTNLCSVVYMVTRNVIYKSICQEQGIIFEEDGYMLFLSILVESKPKQFMLASKFSSILFRLICVGILVWIVQSQLSYRCYKLIFLINEYLSDQWLKIASNEWIPSVLKKTILH